MAIDFDKAVELYRKTIEKARDLNYPRNVAHKHGKDALYIAYPELKKDTCNLAEYGALWARCGSVLRNVYPSGGQFQAETAKDKTKNSDASFMDCMRKAAETGFIPKGKYLEAFVNGKSEQISSYINFLKKEGWEIEVSDYGYVCVNNLRLEAQRKAEAERKNVLEEIARLQEQIKNLAAKVK